MMKSNKKKLSKRTLVLALVAVLLLASGGIMGSRANLTIFSQDYEGHFALDHLQVYLLENGEAVIDKHTLDGAQKQTGTLLAWMNGKVQPGKTYTEEIAAQNATGLAESVNEGKEPVDQFVRLSIRKYWKDPSGKKDPKMDPKLIQLSYADKNGNKDGAGYNSSAWVINPDETTAERTTYYYRTVLHGTEVSAPVINQIRIDDKVVSDVKKTAGDKVGNKTIYTYEYKYNGYIACLEADVQAVQTHNAKEAIHSVWGLDDDVITISGSSLSIR